MKRLLVLYLSVVVSLANEVDVGNFAASSKLFNGDVYSEILVDNDDNILVSPFSVETILALTQSGAVDLTGSEIRSTLYLPETKEETEALIKGVLPEIHSDQYTLKTANKVYVENNFLINDNFKIVATDVYQADFQNIEFTQNVEAADEINTWIEDQTNDKIHNVVSPDDLDEATRVVLVNALYFEANWTFPFEPPLTKKASFYSPKKEIKADTMYIESAEFNFYESVELDAKFLELPFLGKDASMTFVLPNKNEGIGILEKSVKTFLSTPEYNKEFVEVFMPKFKIEAAIEFKDILERLGVHTAFDPVLADFSGIAGVSGDIIISKVTQKTFIDVNEVGVEAAAATVVVGPTSVPPPATQVFKADHPFIFYIKVNDIILFEGRVLDPSQ